MLGFTFFESYDKALRCLPDSVRLSMYDAINDYMFRDLEPDLDDTYRCMFELMRPTLDKSKARGKAGATKSKQNQTESNRIKRDQTESNEIKSKLSPPKDKEKDKEKDKDIKDYCPELSVIDIPLNDGTIHHVTQKDVDEYQKLYPAVNVMQELRNMKGWCMDNPKRKKTKSGVRRFIGGWLANEQNKGKNREPPDKNRFNRFPQQQYDFDDIKQRLVSNG